MSPVFRHGRLRLYLLKLLDEAPRHGYEVIRLLQDRFMGVYAPSPGTIYPRLARLEEEGLVTHDEVDGKKVYRITDKGREEIQGRLDDLADLEEEITESVRDIAREVTEDVRDTVRNLREELTAASREVRDGRERARDAAREKARRARDEVRDSARQARDELHGESHLSRGEWPGWQEWPGWTGWASRTGWRSWPDAAGRPGRGGKPGAGRPRAGRPDAGRPDAGRPDAGIVRDLERMGLDFARELMAASWRTEAFGADALTDLRAILEDTLTRIKDEVFGAAGPWSAETGEEDASPAGGESGGSPDDEAGGSASADSS